MLCTTKRAQYDHIKAVKSDHGSATSYHLNFIYQSLKQNRTANQFAEVFLTYSTCTTSTENRSTCTNSVVQNSSHKPQFYLVCTLNLVLCEGGHIGTISKSLT